MEKDDINDALLGKEKENKDEKEYELCSSLWTIFKLSYMPIIGTLFHPMY